MNLARFPRIRLGHFPTPLEPMERLTKHLRASGPCPTLWIKRDDATGLSTGGNKTRKLEYLMAEAVALGADIVLTQGATQSNHARQTAAACAKLGLDCRILLEDRTGYTDAAYTRSANVMMDLLHGATITRRPGGTDMVAAMDTEAERLRGEGRTAYVIPGGGSNPVGALGYVTAALELVNQANEIGLRVDHLVHATGSAGTQAGLVAGLVGLNAGINLLGIGTRAPKDRQEANVLALARRTADHIGLPADTIRAEHVRANCDYVGQGYGIPTEGMVAAVKLLAEQEGILLDPVYSGKGMAGLLDLIRKGEFPSDENLVFLHTGGQVGLFGYPDAFDLPAH